MQDQHDLTPAQRRLESALRSVAPSAARVDSIAAAFSAGRQAARRRTRFWQSAAALLLLAAAGSWLAPTRRAIVLPNDRSGPAVVEAQQLLPARRLSNQSLLVLQAVVREKGVDGLPAPDVSAAQNVQLIGNF